MQQLPSSLCAEIGGLLVEEVDMLATCQLPGQRVVMLSGATSLVPSPAMMRTLLKADARAFQSALAQAAGPSETKWAFTQVEGELISGALNAASDWDVLMLGYRRMNKVTGSIVFLQSSGAPTTKMIDIPQRFSDQLDAKRVTFLVKEATDETVPDRNATTTQFETLEHALTALARKNAQAVVVNLGDGPVRNHSDLLRLLEAARCPVIVFGATDRKALLDHSIHIPPHPSKVGPRNGS